MEKINVLIMGAAGRDFHNFNVFYRNNELYRVKAFTATQIPNIEGRIYPPELAGDMYPEGIPIHPEEKLAELVKKHNIQEVVFSYSDIPHEVVMHKAALVNSLGVSFRMLGAAETMVKSVKPLIAIGAVRTGCGKSQTTRFVCKTLKDMGYKVAAIRHPMPYGDLAKQAVQRFASLEDLKKHECTIEEMEEYEPHIMTGTIIYAGVDYEAILRQAEQEADVIVWDGGNNDMPFYAPDYTIIVADPLRPGHEISYYPGETNIHLADAVVINKIGVAEPDDIEEVRVNIRETNPNAAIIEAASPIDVEDPEIITGKQVLVVEDGPTLTHGEMMFGAGVVAAEKFGAADLVDPRPFLVGTLRDTFAKYPDIGTLLPAMGYGGQQMKDLEETINKCECDAVIIGTPIDLRRIININKPSTRVTYDLQVIGKPDLGAIIRDKFAK
jgi:predicted GTPase